MNLDDESALRQFMASGGRPGANHESPGGHARDILQGLWCALGTLLSQDHSAFYAPEADDEVPPCARFN